MNYLLLVPNNGNSNWNRKVEIQGQEKLVRLTTVDSRAGLHIPFATACLKCWANSMAPPLLKVTLNDPLPCQPPGGIKQVFSAKIKNTATGDTRQPKPPT